ncbi:MAG: hypothetical protein K6A92_05740 [Lachnospiraceae bacterium]|nr:hypothetical protein [Lachnospiraceae bacterium]
MRKRAKVCAVLLLMSFVTLTGCGKNPSGTLIPEAIPEESAAAIEKTQQTTEEQVSTTEEMPAPTEPGGTEEGSAQITEEQALGAIRNYCLENNPDLEDMLGSEDYTLYFDVSTNEEGRIVVLYRSYTGAQVRYYIDPDSGETYVTEFVPGITEEEERTDETLNVKDHME